MGYKSAKAGGSASRQVNGKVRQHVHCARRHSYYTTKYSLKHSGDYLFMHEKISSKKVFHRETIELAIASIALFLAILYGLHSLTQASYPVILVALGVLFYLVTISFKAYVFLLALHIGVLNPTRRELSTLHPDALPTYTVLVPAYKEKGVIKNLIRATNKLDYPRDKLDIKILLEDNDSETIGAVAECKSIMGPEYSVMVLAHSLPKTKPKSLNAGLIAAKGEFLTIYDAEDVPDPDQLKKAAWIFMHSDNDLVALQSKLSFYNPEENMLSMWFSAEYAVWFEYVLPGLHAIGLPIPLGGTSNHFRTKVLMEVGGWDPYNVTEDADLGMRLCRIGGRIGMIESITWGESVPGNTQGNKYGVAMMDSVTLEESNHVMSNWLHQRSRWIKGFIQTFIVHFRHPLQTWHDYSAKGLLTFFFIIIGTPVNHLLNLFFWMLTIAWLLTQSSAITVLFPEPILTLGWMTFIAGNVLFIAMHVMAPLRRKQMKIALAALFIPFYWLLMSLATVRAIWQLAFHPHHWDKTEHGTTSSLYYDAELAPLPEHLRMHEKSEDAMGFVFG